MCGIFGVFNFSRSVAIEPSLLGRMAETMIHRGPDDDGLYISPEGSLALGFRRLSIVDISGGHQPMCNEDGTIWIVFNGEIYNHLEIRHVLETKGHVYKSKADTETIIHLYEEKGIDCVYDLRGMFAFAIWDLKLRRLFLARDRIGIKPLYYTFQNGLFLFGSEIKAILAYSSIDRDINTEALSYYLTFMIPPAPLTMFEKISKLAAGHRMAVDRQGNVKHDRYWDAIVPSDVESRSEEYYVERIRELLTESIRLRMMSDVPFGVFLSGGMDSSTNVALMAGFTNQPVNTFTVGFKTYEKYNELQYARQIAREFGTNHHEILIDHHDMLSYLPQLIYSQDEPIADWVCVPLYFVSKLARDHGIVVVQVGEGADELFCGYPHYMQSLLWQQRYLPWLQRVPNGIWHTGMRLTSASRIKDWSFAQRVNRFIERAADRTPPFWGGAIVYRGRVKGELLDTPFWHDNGYREAGSIPQKDYNRLLDAKPEADLLERMIYLELKQRLPELLLMRVDKITMSTSVEARVPFLDHKLVEFAMTIPMEVKVRNGRTKSILKKAVEGIIPQDIVHRPKQGFAAPVNEWFQGELADTMRQTVLESPIHKRGYFNRSFVQRLVDDHVSGRRDVSVQLWNLFNLNLWYGKWIESV